MAEKRTNGIWRANFTYTVPGTGERRRCRTSLRTHNKREAERREAQLRFALENPQEVAPKQDPKKHISFNRLCDLWMERHVSVNLKPSTQRSMDQIVRVHLKPAFGSKGLRDITIEDVDLYKARKAKSLAPKTVNNHLSVISRLFNCAIRWQYADLNPIRGVDFMRAPPTEMQFWEPEQSDAFLAAVQRVRPGWLPFFLTALRTGMRLGELVALRWKDVDFATGTIWIRQSYTHGHLGSPKSNKTRVVPMSPELQRVLREHRGLGELVFPGPDGAFLTRARVKHPFWTSTRAAGVPQIRIHDLRHTFASQLAMKGVPIRTIQELLGHADIRQTMRYAHLAPTTLASAVAVLDESSGATGCPIPAPSGQNGGGFRGEPR